MNHKDYPVLFVDDDENLLQGVRRNLRRSFSVETAIGSEAALSLIAERPCFAVVVSDMRMPGVDGVAFLEMVKERSPDSIRIMMTGNADQGTAASAINRGEIFRFLSKPTNSDQLTRVLEDAIRQYQLVSAEKQLLQQTLLGGVRILTDVLTLVDPAAFGQAVRLRELVKQIAEKLNYPNPWEIELAAMLANIGRVVFPQADSDNGARYGNTVPASLDRIAQVGHDLLKNIPRMDGIAEAVLYQNKGFDGSGYPQDSVRGVDIPFGARIIKLAKDLLQAEGRGQNRRNALQRLIKQAALYDPAVVAAARELFDIQIQPSPHREIVELPVAKLRVGMVVAKPAISKDGILLLPAENSISVLSLERLQNYARWQGVIEPIYVFNPDVKPCDQNPDEASQYA